MNHVQWVQQYYFAISSHSGLLRTAEHTNYKSIAGQPKVNWIGYTTWSLSLDELMSLVNHIPTYIKVDVDGGESDVVDGMTALLQRPELKSVLIEVNDQTRAGVIAKFNAAGFRQSFQSEPRGDAMQRTTNIIFQRHRAD